MGAVPAGGNVWKTIAIGVVTTVLGYSIINLIFGKKESGKKKEATVSAWKAIGKSNEFFLNDYYAEFCRKDNEQIGQNLQRIVNKQINDYELLQKKPDLDDDLALYINRYIERCRAMQNFLEDYFNARKAVSRDSAITETQRNEKIVQLDSSYIPKFTSLLTQDSSMIAKLYGDLSDKYGKELKPLTLPPVTAEKISGTWGDGKISFRFDADNSLLMTDDGGQQYRGRWALQNNTVSLSFDGSEVNYHIIHYGRDYLRFTVNEMTDERQLCRQ